jgi:predicted PurR-regulated permease PerM
MPTNSAPSSPENIKNDPLSTDPAGSCVSVATLQPRLNVYEISAWIITGVALLLVLKLHLLSALLAGLLVYELIHLAAPLLRIGKMSHGLARLLVATMLAGFIVSLLVLLIWAAVYFFRGQGTSISALLQKMAEIIERVRFQVPTWVVGYLPEGPDGLQTEIVHWLRNHAGELQKAGKEVGLIGAHILVGMVIGAIISIGNSLDTKACRPLAGALRERAIRFKMAFHAIVFAQVRISVINTFFAGLYLAVALPLFGIHLPLVKTMVAITFFVGLLPVIGNLISNTIIVVIALSHSLTASGASLIFLVLIHKLEYFLNAHIVGSQIHARAWELLVVMLVMETAFGIPGLIAAPIYYAYLKNELADRGLV